MDPLQLGLQLYGNNYPSFPNSNIPQQQVPFINQPQLNYRQPQIMNPSIQPFKQPIFSIEQQAPVSSPQQPQQNLTQMVKELDADSKNCVTIKDGLLGKYNSKKGGYEGLLFCDIIFLLIFLGIFYPLLPEFLRDDTVWYVLIYTILAVDLILVLIYMKMNIGLGYSYQNSTGPCVMHFIIFLLYIYDSIKWVVVYYEPIAKLWVTVLKVIGVIGFGLTFIFKRK